VLCLSVRHNTRYRMYCSTVVRYINRPNPYYTCTCSRYIFCNIYSQKRQPHFEFRWQSQVPFPSVDISSEKSCRKTDIGEKPLSSWVPFHNERARTQIFNVPCRNTYVSGRTDFFVVTVTNTSAVLLRRFI
jgi:hypothetical protein